MKNGENNYLDLCRKILAEGELKDNRTGVRTIAIAGAMLEHDMSEGFPLLTTKKVYFKGIKAELEFFIKGLTDKQWLQERGCHIWDSWSTMKYAPEFKDNEERLTWQKNNRDLGPLGYSFQWRNFGGQYGSANCLHYAPLRQGIDQLANIVNTLKINPNDRRMIVSAWNPAELQWMALPPCHYAWQLTVINNKVNLLYIIRSQDILLGAPFNLASYALLLHLLVLEANMYRRINNLPEFIEGKVIGMLGDVHIYENHIDQVNEQLSREPRKLPKIVTENFTSIFDWQYTDSRVEGYDPHPAIKGEVAV